MTESLEVDERKGEAREATSSRPETRPNKPLVLVLFSFHCSRSLPFRSLSACSHPPSSPSLCGCPLQLPRHRLHLTAHEFAIGSARAALACTRERHVAYSRRVEIKHIFSHPSIIGTRFPHKETVHLLASQLQISIVQFTCTWHLPLAISPAQTCSPPWEPSMLAQYSHAMNAFC